MNIYTERLIKKAGLNTQYVDYFGPRLLEQLVNEVVKECAEAVRSTDLSDVEGGDSSVLYAASEQLKARFGVK